MDESRQQLIDARQVITLLTRVCRQTRTFMDGVSVMDKNRVQLLLREAIQKGEKFLEK
jgi:hypothetical protein